jgi:Holliday junction resolvase RusA-like endonuclease
VIVTFTVPGKPFAKQRARATRQGRIYTPKETVSFERVVGQLATRHFSKPITGPVRLSVIATFVPPASWSAKKRAAHMGKPHVLRSWRARFGARSSRPWFRSGCWSLQNEALARRYRS